MRRFPRMSPKPARSGWIVAVFALLIAVGVAHADWPGSPFVNVPVCAAPGAAGFRRASDDGLGGLLVAWTDTRSDSADIYVQRMTAAGTPSWSVNGVRVCGAMNDQDQADVISDGAGGAIVVWRDMRGGPTGDLYAQRVLASGAMAWAADGVEVCVAANEQANPILIADGFGGAIVIWEDNRAGVAIYAQRLRFDGQTVWSTDGVRLSSSSAPQFEPVACSDGAGGALVVWEEQSAGGYDVSAQSIDANGFTSWGANGVTVCSAADDQVHAQVVSDGLGGAVVVWEDYRAGAPDLWAQRLSLFGLARFATNGVPVCTVTGDQRWPKITSDGATGAIITWQDERLGESDIYAQRLSGTTGERLWTVSGVIVANAASVQQFPTLTQDGLGGAILAWEDARNGTSDVFAQRLTSAGARRWAANGIAVSSAAGNQYQPIIAPGQDSVAVIVWADQRTGGSDLYAQRVPFQVTLDVQPSFPETVMLRAQPEPTRGRTELSFDLPRAGNVELSVHDASGRRVRTLVRSGLAAGRQRFEWDGRDSAGGIVPAGLYFARVSLEGRGLAARRIRLIR